MSAESSGPRAVTNAFTVDVEEHFQVSGFEDVVSRDTWENHPSRVVANTRRLLDLMDETSVKATFFVLGWVAERHPGLVPEIARRGHEIGSHGHSHRLIYQQSQNEFRAETERSRRVLQDQSGQPVVGYRAASFSIGARNMWALDVLAEAGFLYDSSIFPVVHDRYGVPGAPRRIHRLTTPAGGQLVEIPPSTLSLGPLTLPVAGGGYLRLTPLAVTRRIVAHLNRRERIPAIVYVHPWEIDAPQPRIRGRWSNRFRHYHGLSRTETKLRVLLSEFRFGTLDAVIREAGFGPLSTGPALVPGAVRLHPA